MTADQLEEQSAAAELAKSQIEELLSEYGKLKAHSVDYVASNQVDKREDGSETANYYFSITTPAPKADPLK